LPGDPLNATASTTVKPPRGNRFFDPIGRFGSRLAEKKTLAIVSLAAAAILLRLALLPWIPIPAPEIQDEFSYLLAGDTLAHGRFTNPPHPLSVYLETIHVDQQPTYQSKYPPGQGAALALGERLGNPWIGVLLSVAAMCAAILWALQGWLPPSWALLGGILALLRLAISSYWINSYWGGAVAAIGGALVIGAVPRIVHSRRARDAVILGLGVAVLANSRPFEGLIFCLPVAVFLLIWLVGRHGPSWRAAVSSFLLPCGLMLLLCGAFMAYYNWRGTGYPFLFPYELNDRVYMSTPSLIWQKLQPVKHYSNPQFDAFYNGWCRAAWQASRVHDIGSAGHGLARNGKRFAAFFFWPELCMPLIALPWILFDHQMRLLLVQTLACFLGYLLIAWWFQPHYAAPLTATVFALSAQALRHLWHWAWRQHRVGVGLVRAVVLAALAMAPFHRYYDHLQPSVDQRARIASQLEETAGDHLVIVRYSPQHDAVVDWVYNRADIDHSKTVWAREIPGVSMQPLLDYFHGRQAWLVEPDEAAPHLSPYILAP
jgi:hypothetical protein